MGLWWKWDIVCNNKATTQLLAARL